MKVKMNIVCIYSNIHKFYNNHGEHIVSPKNSTIDHTNEPSPMSGSSQAWGIV